MGDWREEIILRRADNTALILFTTNISTDHRIHTLMHDPQYRTAIAWQNSAYNQPPHPSFFLGYDMAPPPVPNIAIKDISNLGVKKPSGSVTAEVLVYPNPSSGQFNVRLNGFKSSKATVVISDITGQVVVQKVIELTGNEQNIAFSIPNRSQGVYILKVTTEEGTKTLKILIEK